LQLWTKADSEDAVTETVDVQVSCKEIYFNMGLRVIF